MGECKHNGGADAGTDAVVGLVRLCGSRGAKERQRKSTSANSEHRNCELIGKLPCDTNHHTCYDFSDICSYRTDKVGHLLPCTRGEHLEECNNFECNSMFKCPKFYCVSWSYVCDNKWDCPMGYDELDHCGENRICPGLYLCRKSQVCLHLNSICDGLLDCPLLDDEKFCSLKHTVCPIKNDCLTFAAWCFNPILNPNFVLSITPFQVVTIQHSDVDLHGENSLDLKGTIFLSIKHTQLESFCYTAKLGSSLKTTTLNFNQIKNITNDCFERAHILMALDLSNNLLKTIKKCHFKNLPLLKVLNLSSNPIKSYSALLDRFPRLITLSFLNVTSLRGSDKIFEGFKGKIADVSISEMCCLVESPAECSLPIPWFVHCGDLLPDTSLEMAFFIMPPVILVLNIVSLVLQRVHWRFSVKSKKSEKTGAFGTTVAGVNISDVTCSLPLFVLLVFHIIYRDTFTLSSRDWRASWSCFLVMTLFLYFNFASPAVMDMLSVSRFMIVDTKFKEAKFVRRFIVGLNLIGLVVASVLTFLLWLIDTHAKQNIITTALCSPFCDPTNTLIIVPVSTLLSTIFQFGSIVFIIVIYWKLLSSLRQSQQNLQTSRSKQQSNVPLIFQIVMMILSTITTWIPCGILFLVFVILSHYPIKILFWSTICGSTINSVVNPSIFLIFTARNFLK